MNKDFKEFCNKTFGFQLEDSKYIAEKVWLAQQEQIDKLKGSLEFYVEVLNVEYNKSEDMLCEIEDLNNRLKVLRGCVVPEDFSGAYVIYVDFKDALRALYGAPNEISNTDVVDTELEVNK
jgi:hypothetical protein